MASTEADFFSCEFSCQRPNAKALLRWIKPNEVIISIQLPGRGAQSSALRGQTWVGTPPGAAKVQERLSGLGDLKLGFPFAHTLYVKSRVKKNVSLMWSAESETLELRELRLLLEAVGHFDYAEARAYGVQGYQVGKSGLYEAGLRPLRSALQILGDRYRSPDLLDDSGMHLIWAEHNEETGNHQAAWQVCSKVLKSRLATYQRLYGLVTKTRPGD